MLKVCPFANVQYLLSIVTFGFYSDIKVFEWPKLIDDIIISQKGLNGDGKIHVNICVRYKKQRVLL